jgi:hypothetical protein
VIVRARLCDPDGADAGTFHTSSSAWRPGDVFAHDDGRVLRIVSMIPAERVEEFTLRRAHHAIWQVEPAA